MKEFKLSNGLIFPAVGYGTYLATKEKGTEAIAQAIEVGYRYFDTASFYMNEEQVGEAIKESRIDKVYYFVSSDNINNNIVINKEQININQYKDIYEEFKGNIVEFFKGKR